jgi:hypothetical protein
MITDLGNGFHLRSIRNDRFRYSHLYKDGIKVNDKIYRAGGMTSGFKDGYCSLIEYTGMTEDNDHKFVIINENGENALEGNRYDAPHHFKGVIALLNDKLYNLKTGEIIIRRYDGSIKSSQYMFVSNVFNEKYKLGVWQIDWYTGEVVEIFE